MTRTDLHWTKVEGGVSKVVINAERLREHSTDEEVEITCKVLNRAGILTDG